MTLTHYIVGGLCTFSRFEACVVENQLLQSTRAGHDPEDLFTHICRLKKHTNTQRSAKIHIVLQSFKKDRARYINVFVFVVVLYKTVDTEVKNKYNVRMSVFSHSQNHK